VIDRHRLFGPTSPLAGVPRRIGRLLHAQAARRERSIDRRHAPRILAALGAVRPEAPTWVVQDSWAGEPTILVVGPRGGAPIALVRVARSRSGQAGVDRAASALTELHERLAGLEVDALLPVPLAGGVLPDRTWHAESFLPGVSARTLLPDAELRRSMLVASAQAIRTIHVATARPVLVDAALVERWVTARAGFVAATLRRGSTASPGAAALDGVASRLASDLLGRTLSVGWIHGDLWPANLLVTGDSAAISGIVDWDSAEGDELALHDRLHLAITTRRLLERKELGPVIAGLLTGAVWTDDDRAVLDSPSGAGAGSAATASDDGLSTLPAPTALWLFWLRFVEANITRHPELSTDRAWRSANVERVLACA
jgi:hypothetical protein